MGNRYLLIGCLILLPSSVFAQGVIGTYADPGGANCNVRDASAGLLTVYVVHTQTSGATASEFYAPVPTCMSGTVWLADDGPGVAIGDTQTGVSVAYGACLSAPIHVRTVNLFSQGLSSACCAYTVLPHPVSGLNAVDCTPAKIPLYGESNRVNGNGACSCGRFGVDEATWGKVKAVFK